MVDLGTGFTNNPAPNHWSREKRISQGLLPRVSDPVRGILC